MASESLKYDFSMNIEKNRRATFVDWPFDEDDGSKCTSDKMAEAGFYHSPTDRDPDVARCFVCFKELEGWEPEDDPWQEHKKHSPRCTFLLTKNKNSEDITIEEFLDIEVKRQENRVNKILQNSIKEFEDIAKTVRTEMEKLVH
ncbi:baculoviral IAP repeat-containing protein 5 [Exaiptasia diaphana]|uniref:Survivin n=1 Tax=Exaiptasia diaphana TaxID=2652724 RepID=A0A913Y155_EXADI|nr:baculoviral IAP repeat-containing protein 5 [Exaiptasia diaphana]KXJ23670.1 Baculoviral IAP repeat-containing protein 5 [Exaiptasia diaphana]